MMNFLIYNTKGTCAKFQFHQLWMEEVRFWWVVVANHRTVTLTNKYVFFTPKISNNELGSNLGLDWPMPTSQVLPEIQINYFVLKMCKSVNKNWGKLYRVAFFCQPD